MLEAKGGERLIGVQHCGRSVIGFPSNCANWIGERIEAVEAIAEFGQGAREQESRNGPEF